MPRGFSLLEVLLVSAILAVIGVSGIGYYRNAAKNIEITSTARVLIADIRTARSNAISGQSALRWGVHVVNGAQDYYEIYSTPTDYADESQEVDTTRFLSSGITFTDPAESAIKDILFGAISGTTTATTITIASQTESQTISVSAIGTVF